MLIIPEKKNLSFLTSQYMTSIFPQNFLWKNHLMRVWVCKCTSWYLITYTYVHIYFYYFFFLHFPLFFRIFYFTFIIRSEKKNINTYIHILHDSMHKKIKQIYGREKKNRISRIWFQIADTSKREKKTKIYKIRQ